MATSKDRLAGSLSKVPGQPPLRKAPQHYPLSTDSALEQNSDSTLSQDNTNAQKLNNTIALSQDNTSAKVQNNTEAKNEPRRVSRGYKLREDLIKACKRIALEDDRLLYEVMEEALEFYIKNYYDKAN